MARPDLAARTASRTMPRMALHLVGVVLSCLACACGGPPTPTDQPFSTAMPLQTSSPPPSPAATLTHYPTASLTATPLPTSTARPSADAAAVDAFEASYFPWASAATASDRYMGEGQAKVINAIFFADPPFFGFDIHPPEQWYHVSGVDLWVTFEGARISPVINLHAQPADGDRVLLHGQIQAQFITADYVGTPGGPVYYYRSLLDAEELRSGMLPATYDGLQVWVRGQLDANQGQGQFYALPEGTSFPERFLGMEGLVVGRLVHGEAIHVVVTRGIYVRTDGGHAQIVEGPLDAGAQQFYERAVVRSVDASTGELVIDVLGTSVGTKLGNEAQIQFADGTPAEVHEILPGQSVIVAGQESPVAGSLTTRVTIVGWAAAGPFHAAYVGDDGELWRVSLDGQDHREITHIGWPEQGLAEAQFSPDGSQFAYTRVRDNQTSIVTGDSTTGEIREWLVDDEWQETYPAWAPDGSRLVLCRLRLEESQVVDASLWVLGLRDGTARRIGGVASPGHRLVDPRWSHDGRFIAYGQVGDEAAAEPALYVLTLPTQVQLALESAYDWQWSPDSTQILCRRGTEQGQSRLWVLQRDGASATWLTPAGMDDWYARWSPDGRQIAFLSRPAGSTDADYLWLAQSDGMRRLQPHSAPTARSLAWSPDGAGVVYLNGITQAQPSELWWVDRDGSQPRLLASGATELVGVCQQPSTP